MKALLRFEIDNILSNFELLQQKISQKAEFEFFDRIQRNVNYSNSPLMPFRKLKINLLSIFLLNWIFLLTVAWKTSDIMSDFSTKINQSDFRGAFIKKSTINNSPFLIIFGGYSLNKTTGQKTMFNNLYKINLLTKQATQLAANKATKPSNRYGVCGVLVRDRLFIYGGVVENITISNELWEYEFLSDEWSFRGNSHTMRKCDFMIIETTYSNDTIALTGLLQNNSTFKIVQYLIFNRTFSSNFKIQVYNSVQLNTTVWDGKQAASFLRIQSLELMLGKAVQNSEIQFPVKFFCNNYILKNFYNMVTNDGVYFIEKTGNVYFIRFWMEINAQELNEIGCGSLTDWYFFFYQRPLQNSSLKNIVVQYLYGPTFTGGLIHKDATNLLAQWLSPVESFLSFTFNNSAFIVNQKLETFYLQKDCDSEIISNKNLLQCVFGMYSCKENWTGIGCNISICEGTVKLYSDINLTQANIECSGNGKCTQKGCVCKQNWGGSACDVYKKKNCRGTLIENFISFNCECNDPTVGGNDCSVVFCYNDCSNKGKCQQNGQCLCNDGYTGADCSILKIGFDLI